VPKLILKSEIRKEKHLNCETAHLCCSHITINLHSQFLDEWNRQEWKNNHHSEEENDNNNSEGIISLFSAAVAFSAFTDTD